MRFNIRAESKRSLFLSVLSNGEQIATATGIIGRSGLGKYALLTNWHVVSGTNPYTNEIKGYPDALVIHHLAKTHEEGHLRWVQITEPLLDADEQPLWKEHPTHGKMVDVAALPLTQMDGIQLLTSVGCDEPDYNDLDCGPADIVSVIGFPLGISSSGMKAEDKLAVWATGFIASEPSVNYHGRPCFLIDSRTREGQSGSAVVSFRSGGTFVPGPDYALMGDVCEFLGLYSGRVHKDADIGFVWKKKALEEVLDEMDRGEGADLIPPGSGTLILTTY